MRGAIPPIPQYAFMAWCSVKKTTGITLPLLYTVAEDTCSECAVQFIPTLYSRLQCAILRVKACLQ
jgi:hypothetical protein